MRYQAFKDSVELGRALVSRCPTKIDIGPVYTHDPRQRAKYAKGAGLAGERRWRLAAPAALLHAQPGRQMMRACGAHGKHVLSPANPAVGLPDCLSACRDGRRAGGGGGGLRSNPCPCLHAPLRVGPAPQSSGRCSASWCST